LRRGRRHGCVAKCERDPRRTAFLVA
jgi:hypothetical protein